MSLIKTAGVIYASDEFLKNKNQKDWSTYFVRQLNKLFYDVIKVSILPENEKLLAHEVQCLNKQLDVLIIVSNLSNGITYKALGKAFSQDYTRNKHLANALDRLNVEYSAEEVTTPSFVSVLEGEPYPLVHFQRTYLVHEKHAEVTYDSVLSTYLKNFNKEIALVKKANLSTDEKVLVELERLSNHSVKVEICEKNENGVCIAYTSNDMCSIVNFENNLSTLCQIDICNPVIDSTLIYSDNDMHVKTALQSIEKCLSEYGPENVFLSFNGGKDCTVLLHLTMVVLAKNHNINKSLVCLYVQSEFPFSEQEEFIKECERFYNLKILTRRMNIKDALKNVLDEYPNYKACLMGTRRTDPYSNDLNIFQMTDRNYPKIMRVNPLLDWRYTNIWDYLLYYKIPYCKLYDYGYTSLGNVNNTVRNPSLSYFDILQERDTYLPAFKLLDESFERSGRNS